MIELILVLIILVLWRSNYINKWNAVYWWSTFHVEREKAGIDSEIYELIDLQFDEMVKAHKKGTKNFWSLNR